MPSLPVVAIVIVVVVTVNVVRGQGGTDVGRVVVVGLLPGRNLMQLVRRGMALLLKKEAYLLQYTIFLQLSQSHTPSSSDSTGCWV